MKAKSKITIIILVFSLLAACAGISTVAASEESFYVCFSSENYAVRNANRMTETDGGYILKDVTLSPSTGFYVTDNAGTRYMGSDNDDLHTDENGSYSYDIFFAPSGELPEGWEKTGCRVSYRFHIPASYEVMIAGESTPLEYNPYFTDYDRYHISCVHIEGGQTVSYGEESHTVSTDGYYRILFTPGETVLGNAYKYNDRGEYGSGDGYEYNLYVEDAPRYYATVVGGAVTDSETEINGEPSYLLTRDESATSSSRYKSEPLFVNDRDAVLKYRIYEESIAGYRLIDDDNDPDTEISDLEIPDAGWYMLNFTDGGANFLTTAEYDERDFGGYYAAGEFNNYCYTENGGLSLDGDYLFKQVEIGDADYTEDYLQYILNLDVTKEEAKDGLELYITDGKTKYRDGLSYIRLNAEGRYKFLFSEEHNYGRGRNYRFTLETGREEREIVISTAEEYNAFAAECNLNADYSRGTIVRIKNDIDFDGEITQIKTFGGTVEGGYHTLKNIKISSDADRTGLIGLLTQYGSILRLNVEITIDAKNSDYVGVICENYGLVGEVTVSGSISGGNYVGGVVAHNGYAATNAGDVVTDSDNNNVVGEVRDCVNKSAVRGVSFAGGIVGYNGGEIEGCENRGRINGDAFRSSDNVLGVGGISGFSYGKITDCTNNGVVGGVGRGVGGVSGICTGEIYFSANKANVVGSRNVGGIAGYYGNSGYTNSDNGSGTGSAGNVGGGTGVGTGGGSSETQLPVGRHLILLYNLNFGGVEAERNVGGIVGYTQTNGLLVRACASDGEISATAGSYAGGVCGYATARVQNCLGMGIVSAKGLNGGLYVGGVCGYGENISYSMSSAIVDGTDYVGGICGNHVGTLVGSYSNVLLVASEDAVHTGGICGDTSAYDAASDIFTNFEYNYFVGEDIGGIDGETYGNLYDDAARRVTAEELSSCGALSPVLGDGFDSEQWLGGKELSYPVSRAFQEKVVCDEFGDDAAYDALFVAHTELSDMSESGARISYNVVFKEWNPDNGDLYDTDIRYDNFETVSTVRYFGDTLAAPSFVYAEEEDGRWVTHGDKADYFAYYDLPEEITSNVIIYAAYDEVQTTLTCDGAFLEGRFGSNATAELVKVGEYYTVTVTGEVTEPLTLKFRVGGNADKYRVLAVTDGEEREIESTVSGEYLAFEYSLGTLFRVEQKSGGLPGWAIGLIFGFVGAAVVGTAWLIIFLTKRRKKHSESK